MRALPPPLALQLGRNFRLRKSLATGQRIGRRQRASIRPQCSIAEKSRPPNYSPIKYLRAPSRAALNLPRPLYFPGLPGLSQSQPDHHHLRPERAPAFAPQPAARTAATAFASSPRHKNRILGQCGGYCGGSAKVITFAPAAKVTNCRPPTEYVIGDVFSVAFNGTRHSVLPSRSLAATRYPLGSP